jgi:hypothetical protein
MTEPAANDAPSPTPAHQLVEHLTIIKLELDWLRHRLAHDTRDPAEFQPSLDRIEHSVDAAATLATNMLGEETRPA